MCILVSNSEMAWGENFPTLLDRILNQGHKKILDRQGKIFKNKKNRFPLIIIII